MHILFKMHYSRDFNNDCYNKFKNVEAIVLKKLANIVMWEEILHELKRHFENKINSKRTLERIHNFKDFFKVLRKRNLLSLSKMEPFSLTLSIIDNSICDEKYSCLEDLEQTVESLKVKTDTDEVLYDKAVTAVPLSVEHESILQNSQLCGSRTEESKSPLNLKLPYNVQHLHPNNDYYKETDCQKLVILEISQRIGKKWRNLARHLDIKEIIIDEVEVKYDGDLKEKAYQILKMSQSQLNHKNWRIKLMNALERVRRRDLRDWVEENYEE